MVAQREQAGDPGRSLFGPRSGLAGALPGGAARTGARLSWHDAIRAHELDDASARSLAKRRTSLLEYQEANEEVGFKGTMTLVGCGMLWALLVVLVISAYFPKLFWVTLPILLVFLALQLLRWAVPQSKQT